MDTPSLDTLMRVAAFERVRRLNEIHDHLTAPELKPGFLFREERIPLVKRPLTSESMIRVYRQEADRQRLLIKKAEVTQNRLLFIVEAIRALREDQEFSRLLQVEKLALMPAFLEQQLSARPAS
jgi:hypothetical protein